MHITQDTLKGNPEMVRYGGASLNVRQEILVKEVPKLGKEAALKAIKEWGQPITQITHLIFCTSSGINMPGPDCELIRIMNLPPSVKRVMIHQAGCFGGAAVLRLAKDLAENNHNARILVVCSENTTWPFHAPSPTHLDLPVGSALFSDGAALVIVGSNPFVGLEKPLFEIVSCEQTLVPDSETEVVGKTSEIGLCYFLSRTVPQTIASSIDQCVMNAVKPFGVKDLNELFFVVHPGGRAILTCLEQKLNLAKDKIKATWHVLAEYGNMRVPLSYSFLMK